MVKVYFYRIYGSREILFFFYIFMVYTNWLNILKEIISYECKYNSLKFYF